MMTDEEKYINYLEQEHLAALDELERLRDFYHRVIDAAATTSLPLIESYIATGRGC